MLRCSSQANSNLRVEGGAISLSRLLGAAAGAEGGGASLGARQANLGLIWVCMGVMQASCWGCVECWFVVEFGWG